MLANSAILCLIILVWPTLNLKLKMLKIVQKRGKYMTTPHSKVRMQFEY